MKKINFCFIVMALFSFEAQAQYNNLVIPEAYYGTTGTDGVTFNLTIKDTLKQIKTTGQATVTGSISSPNVKNNFWGPTLIINKGDLVHMNVTNNLNEATTIHWHGMHLPAVMDGGPHQIIPAGTLWQPYWTMNNKAATYWYHPHLHESTESHIAKGIGGFLIVKDAEEAALNLPRTYGVDDHVLALTSRKYTSSNQFDISLGVYGDYMLTNGTPNAQVTLPKQFVRLRILNAEVERGYDLGFSDLRTFYIIGNDGGLLNAPVAATKVKLLVGERVEILVNLGNDAVGSSLELKAYNAGQTFGFPGGEPNTTGNFGSLLNNSNFNVLHINVGATTSNPVTTLPTTLANNTYLTDAQATVTRTVSVTGGQGPVPFTFDNTSFVLTTINKTVNLNDIEKWTISNTSNSIFGHSFHIHDVEFKIVARNGSATAVGAHESGWKDTFYLPKGESVTFVAKFDDYADLTHPFMYHCHFGNHEDKGMMGQFIVDGTLKTDVENAPSTNYSIYPNPTQDKLFIKLADNNTEIYYITISTIEGRVAMMLPRPQWKNGIDISSLSSGVYLLKMMDEKTKSETVRKFVKQ